MKTEREREIYIDHLQFLLFYNMEILLLINYKMYVINYKIYVMVVVVHSLSNNDHVF